LRYKGATRRRCKQEWGGKRERRRIGQECAGDELLTLTNTRMLHGDVKVLAKGIRKSFRDPIDWIQLLDTSDPLFELEVFERTFWVFAHVDVDLQEALVSNSLGRQHDALTFQRIRERASTP
jgi:hypothetical protein